MQLTVHRQPVLRREKIGRKVVPVRSAHHLETRELSAELLPAKRVQVRFPMGDWREFRDNGEPCTAAMADWVLDVAAERVKEKAAKKAAKAKWR